MRPKHAENRCDIVSERGRILWAAIWSGSRRARASLTWGDFVCVRVDWIMWKTTHSLYHALPYPLPRFPLHSSNPKKDNFLEQPLAVFTLSEKATLYLLYDQITLVRILFGPCIQPCDWRSSSSTNPELETDGIGGGMPMRT